MHYSFNNKCLKEKFLPPTDTYTRTHTYVDHCIIASHCNITTNLACLFKVTGEWRVGKEQGDVNNLRRFSSEEAKLQTVTQQHDTTCYFDFGVSIGLCE